MSFYSAALGVGQASSPLDLNNDGSINVSDVGISIRLLNKALADKDCAAFLTAYANTIQTINTALGLDPNLASTYEQHLKFLNPETLKFYDKCYEGQSQPQPEPEPQPEPTPPSNGSPTNGGGAPKEEKSLFLPLTIGAGLVAGAWYFMLRD